MKYDENNEKLIFGCGDVECSMEYFKPLYKVASFLSREEFNALMDLIHIHRNNSNFDWDGILREDLIAIGDRFF